MLIVFFFLCPPHHLVGYLSIYNFSNLDLMLYLLSILLFFLDLQVGFCQLEYLVLCFLCIFLHIFFLDEHYDLMRIFRLYRNTSHDKEVWVMIDLMISHYSTLLKWYFPLLFDNPISEIKPTNFIKSQICPIWLQTGPRWSNSRNRHWVRTTVLCWKVKPNNFEKLHCWFIY